MDTQFGELPHPPLPGGFPTALVGDHGFQILFQDNAQTKLKKGEGLPGVRDLKCTKTIHREQPQYSLDRRRNSTLKYISFHFALCYHHTQKTSARLGGGACLIHKASCKRAIVAKTWKLAPLSSPGHSQSCFSAR